VLLALTSGIKSDVSGIFTTRIKGRVTLSRSEDGDSIVEDNSVCPQLALGNAKILEGLCNNIDCPKRLILGRDA
jgi:hypothetical protein